MKPVIRCSQLDQLFECPGSFTLQQIAAPRDRKDPWEGNWVHWSVAQRLVAELGATPPEGSLPAPELPESYNPPKTADWLIDFCVRQAQQTVPLDWSLEVEVPLAFEFDRFILSGHHDMLALSPDAKRAKGKDWKAVRNVVDPADCNNQALGYIVLEKRAYPGLQESEFEIVQPRANEDEGEQRISSVVVEGRGLDEAVEYLEARVNKALDELDQINTGPRQCRWCSAAMQCPAIQALIEVMKMQLTPEMIAKIKADPTNQLLADLVISAKIVDQPLKDAKEMLHERLAGGKSVVASSGVRIESREEPFKYEVTNPGALYANLVSTLPAHEVAKVVTPKVAELKDALARVLNIPKTGKAPRTAESEFADRFKPHMHQGTRRVFKFS